jgi:hypothetical protein
MAFAGMEVGVEVVVAVRGQLDAPTTFYKRPQYLQTGTSSYEVLQSTAKYLGHLWTPLDTFRHLHTFTMRPTW